MTRAEITSTSILPEDYRTTRNEGETIEQKVRRIVENGEAIDDGAETIYTERKDGVIAGYNPRTDRFDVALEAMDLVSASKRAKREGVMKVLPLS